MILGIESSCDDSSLAIMSEDFKVLFYKKISQYQHEKFGGVVPELASRLHTIALYEMMLEVKKFSDTIRAVAVTNEPGLSVSLITGVSLAKSISLSLNIPIIGVNHLFGHIFSLFLEKKEDFPMAVLLVSGGHTMILDIDKFGNIKLIATTSDDSFGESFDKVAKMLNLGYPGGEKIEKFAKNGDENVFNFTIPMVNNNREEFSFSGLKNQVRIEIENIGTDIKSQINNICASFQKTACLHILNKLEKTIKKYKFKKLGVVGGASANLYLRGKLQDLCNSYNINLLFAPLEFCSDNALMIARCGLFKYQRMEFNNLDLNIKPTTYFDKLNQSSS